MQKNKWVKYLINIYTPVKGKARNMNVMTIVVPVLVMLVAFMQHLRITAIEEKIEEIEQELRLDFIDKCQDQYPQ